MRYLLPLYKESLSSDSGRPLYNVLKKLNNSTEVAKKDILYVVNFAGDVTGMSYFIFFIIPVITLIS